MSRHFFVTAFLYLILFKSYSRERFYISTNYGIIYFIMKVPIDYEVWMVKL